MSVNVVSTQSGPVPAADTNSNVILTFPYVPGTLDSPAFVADRAYRVVSITGRVEVAGTGGAATAVVKKAASGTALAASGTALHTGSYNFVGTAATNQALTLSTTTTDLDIAAGTCIGVDATGTLTSATGVFTIVLTPA